MTLHDFCVIQIGEEDFKTSRDYTKLVKLIREKVTAIKHTNTILCLPTYKNIFYKAMYNWRVEVFNNIICNDNLNNNYAYIIDSNQNLTCDYDMFSEMYGNVNNRGVLTIFNQIEKLITEIDSYSEYLNNSLYETENYNSNFFRD